MKNVIITGADGFVGSYTVKEFLKNGINVLAMDIPAEPRRLEKHSLLKYVSCDVTDLDSIRQIVEKDAYDTIVHFAWAGSAGPERVNYDLQTKNAINTVELLKLSKDLGIGRFVCAGSIMEREVEAAVHSQGSKPGLAYIYGVGKHLAHSLCKMVAADIGIELMWPMITNAYGAGELSPRFVNTTIRKIINQEPLQFTAATQNYDFVYVTDVAKAFYLIAEKGKPFCEYIIGSGNARPLREFILEMQRELAPEAEPIFGDIPFTGTNMPLSAFDTSDLSGDTGFEATISFAEGTRLTMDWLKTIEEEKK